MTNDIKAEGIIPKALIAILSMILSFTPYESFCRSDCSGGRGN